jgi:hypothetical protein
LKKNRPDKPGDKKKGQENRQPDRGPFQQMGYEVTKGYILASFNAS